MTASKKGAYVLSAGMSVKRASLDTLVTKLKAAGIHPLVRQETRAVDVYRLVSACFATRAAAQEHQKAVARRNRQVFLVHDGEGFCVVAGALFSEDAARTEQDRLARKNLKTRLVKARATLPVWVVSVGDYDDPRAAAAEMERLAVKGIKVNLLSDQR